MDGAQQRANAFTDRHDIAFGDYRKHLPAKARDFPPPERIKSHAVMRQFHFLWDHCQVCGRGSRRLGVKLEAHHIIGGQQGRSDELCNLLMLCDDHHRDVKTRKLPQGLLIWCKWRTDRFNTDWVRLAILSRRFLPDLIIDRELAASYFRELTR